MARSSILFLFVFLAFHLGSFAQEITDTTFVRTALKYSARQYDQFIGVQSGVINGHEYKQPRYSETEHPYFAQFDWLPGSVVYNGEKYENVSLLYDISSDNLILESHINGQEIQLIKVKISEFVIDGHQFSVLRMEENPGLSQSGFYEILYTGPSQVVVRHQKNFEEKIENNKMVFYYISKSRIFIKKGERFVRVSRKGDVIKLFKDRNNQVRSFIRQQHIVLSKNNPRGFAEVAAYYDSLTAAK